MKSSNETDEQILEEVKKGDQGALGRLYSRYAPLIFYIAARRLDRETAEDLLQEVFLSVWKKAETFQSDRGSVKSWITQIVNNLILNEYRRRSRRITTQPDEDLIADYPSEEAEPVEALWAAYQSESVRKAVDLLPSRQREALSLAFFEDLSHAQISQTLRLPLGTVKTRIRSALGQMRTKLLTILGLVLGLAGIGWGWWQSARQDAIVLLQHRGIAMATASDLTVLHLGATPGTAAALHGSYRSEPGKSLGALAFHRFPTPPEGYLYQGWALYGGDWISLGISGVDAQGDGFFLADNPRLRTLPDALEVTLEPARASSRPTGAPLIRYDKP